MASDDDPLRRLQILHRDLLAATESQLQNIERLSSQLDASVKDLELLLKRNKKNQASRATLQPTTTPLPDTIAIDDVQYRIRDEFREAAITVADELDLDELEAAKLCILSQFSDHAPDSVLALRAMVRFHEQRQALLDCMRLLLHLGLDTEDGEDGIKESFNEAARRIVEGRAQQGNEEKRPDPAAFWRNCVDGLMDIEAFLKKLADYKDKLIMTGQNASPNLTDALRVQRLLLTQQHESLCSIMAYLIRGTYVQPEDYRIFLSKASTLEAEIDITIHYLPILVSGASHIASDHAIPIETARDLHQLFAAGPAQLQWKQPMLKAAATISWLAEYNARFSTGSNELNQSEADRKRYGEARSKLAFDALANKAFHFMLAAAAFLKPVSWHDPSRIGIIDFLVETAVSVVEMPRASDHFSATTMRELQVFTDAFVTNMPDVLRKLKLDEDDMRRSMISQAPNAIAQAVLNLERFMVIMACAYQDDTEAARDFWSDKESNLYGFLRWVSQRLPTPRIAAFCQLLRSIACDDKTANQAHRFLLEDAVMTSGKLRKAYAVSWTQIFSELELYASKLRNRPASITTAQDQERTSTEDNYDEPETGIMLDSYLGLAAHICRTSSEARSWLLKEQPFHLGEVMFQLARTADAPRIRACCLDMLSALLTDKVSEVRNGMWVLLDSWISGAGLENATRPRVHYPAKRYLEAYANSAEAGASLLNMLSNLITPVEESAELSFDSLPFPENLGAPHRHAGIEVYVDFVMDAVFAKKVPRMPIDGELSLLDLVRYECLNFAYLCLSTFNEDLVFLANTSNVGVESAMETKSLTTYARLHPFARVMEWMFDKAVVDSLFMTLQQNIDTLNNAQSNSPLVRATLRSLQVLNLAWKLQPTYFDIVRPLIVSQTAASQPVGSSTLTSVDDAFLLHLNAIIDIAQFSTCKHVDISLESIALLKRLGSSRKLVQSTDAGSVQSRRTNRLLGMLTPLCTVLTTELRPLFELDEWDLETNDIPAKLAKAKAILDLLRDSLHANSGKASIAHALLGFNCYERSVEVLPQSAFAAASALFHGIVSCAAELPLTSGDAGYRSWLLNVKRGCLEIVLQLAVSPLTSQIIQPQLRTMEFFPALSRSQAVLPQTSLWDGKTTADPALLLESSAVGVSDFMHIRKACFEFAATDLRTAAERRAFSVQEKLVATILGTVKLPTGEQVPAPSTFELFDFFDLEVAPALEPKYDQCVYFGDMDLSSCTKHDAELLIVHDTNMAYQLLALHKKELKNAGVLRDQSDSDKAQDELQAIFASLASQNSWRTIHSARLAALEAWTELLSLVVTNGGLAPDAAVALSLQGLLVVLPKFDKSLAENMEAAALMAKLTLTFTHAISAASQDSSQQTANVAMERLLAIFRISLKVLTDSATDPALRDVAYRTSTAILSALPGRNSGASTLANAKQLLQFVQSAGERLLTVVTEDAFSGRGVTRVSALLFLDGLVSLFQSLKVTTSLLRGLMKLNFIPVLIDMSIGGVSAAFKTEDETVTTLAYFHTALALLLRLCQTSDGSQLVLNSGFFVTVDESKLFTTDPDIGLDIDNPTALKEFHSILADLLRVITATVISKGAQPGQAFLQQHRYTVQAIFKQAARGHANEVADELSRLIMATDFLEEDKVAMEAARIIGFS